jgi:hypothetical protein
MGVSKTKGTISGISSSYVDNKNSLYQQRSRSAQFSAYWTSVQIKMVPPSELLPYPKILFAWQTLPHKG